MKKETVIATVLSILAFVNQVLAMFGKSPLPIENETVVQIVTAVFTLATWAYTWWHNNSITKEAQKADEVKDALKKKEITPDKVDEILPGKEKVNPNLYECFATNNRCYKSTVAGTNRYKMTKPVGIVVHDEGTSNPWLKRYVQPSENDPNRDELQKLLGENKYNNSWNRDDPNLNKCAHAWIGDLADGTVATMQTLPWNFPCWLSASGKKGSYNGDPTAHIQFEICRGDYEDEERFNRLVKGEAVALCAYLCRMFDLSPDTICDHSEAHDRGYASDHSDITAWLKVHDYTMDDFRKWVKDAI